MTAVDIVIITVAAALTAAAGVITGGASATPAERWDHRLTMATVAIMAIAAGMVVAAPSRLSLAAATAAVVAATATLVVVAWRQVR